VTLRVCEKVAQNKTQTIFCQNLYKTFTVEKEAQNLKEVPKGKL
jgi:hypothetical protein